MKRTGEVEMLSEARQLSFPRGESAAPTTWISGRTAFSAS